MQTPLKGQGSPGPNTTGAWQLERQPGRRRPHSGGCSPPPPERGFALPSRPQPSLPVLQTSTSHSTWTVCWRVRSGQMAANHPPPSPSLSTLLPRCPRLPACPDSVDDVRYRFEAILYVYLTWRAPTPTTQCTPPRSAGWPAAPPAPRSAATGRAPCPAVTASTCPPFSSGAGGSAVRERGAILLTHLCPIRLPRHPAQEFVLFSPGQGHWLQALRSPCAQQQRAVDSVRAWSVVPGKPALSSLGLCRGLDGTCTPRVAPAPAPAPPHSWPTRCHLPLRPHRVLRSPCRLRTTPLTASS